jgi:hypothetical protein
MSIARRATQDVVGLITCVRVSLTRARGVCAVPVQHCTRKLGVSEGWAEGPTRKVAANRQGEHYAVFGKRFSSLSA